MSAEARDKVKGALRETVPELSTAQVDALEVGVWNWALKQCDKRGNVKIFDHALRDDYCRRAAHCAANLSRGPLGNGNEWLLPLVLAGSVEPYDIPFMDACALNRPLVEGDMDVKKRRALHDRGEYVAVTTLFECPRCSERKATFRQLQIRSADEGSTLFVHCLSCGHDWRESD